MKRPFAVLLCLAVIAGSFSFESFAVAQDLTITIKKGDKDTTIIKKNEKDDKSKQPFTGTRPSVDVAILLDTSNSMDGLISQAKSQLWNIIQQFADAKKNGQTPQLRVSVFEYGNTSLPASEGYIRQVVQLTNDLDAVSEALFALKTNGGDEYCGMVIDEAVKRLDWSNEPNAYKTIFIAGNEPFTQGSVAYQKACKQAIGNGIIVNTIHCGDYQTGISGMWQNAAELAEGKYLNIDQDQTVVHIKCPQDKILIELNSELNKTYLWYGAEATRRRYSANQIEQDSNAFGIGASSGLAKRAETKMSSLYSNSGRDLVDSFGENSDEVLELEEAVLPEAMQKMAPAERKAHVEAMAAKRAEIVKKMAEVSKERAIYLADQKTLAAPGAAATLGDAVSGTVQEQLQASGFDVDK